MQHNDQRYPDLQDYGVIGDCRSLALVSRMGSIDWWCEPRFDAPSLFARILDVDAGGSFHFESEGLESSSRRYLPSSAILETALECDGGSVSVTDFLAILAEEREFSPEPYARQKLVRLVKGTGGVVRLRVRCEPRPAYGRRDPMLRWADPACDDRGSVLVAGSLAGAAGRRALHLTATRPWSGIDGGAAVLDVELRPGDEVGLVIDYGPGDRQGEGMGGHEAGHAATQLSLDDLHAWQEETHDFWRRWSSISTYQGEHHDTVERSAITLKLLTYHPSGALVAAGTTSLPEQIGGERNWDYRFTWLRDASFTLYSLTSLGYRSEAAAFMEWLHRTCRSDPDPLVLYRVDGTRPGREVELHGLAGYRGSRPVRVGNSASWQRQLDMYGGVLDAAYLALRAGDEITDAEWTLFSAFADFAARRWRLPDASIWEVRGGKQHFVYSKVMCWVALDRACRLAEMTGRSEAEADRIAHWREEADAIRAAVRERGMRSDGAFAQSFGSERLDSAALLFPLVGYCDVRGEAMEATLSAIRNELMDGELVRRYEPDRNLEGVSGHEGHFLLCSFWYCDNLALRGELDEARRRYLALLEKANDLGIFTEQWSADEDVALGNLPQALTHLAVISTSHNLQRAAAGRAHGQVRSQAPGDRD